MAESDEDILTPVELRQWLQREVRDVMKASELRIKDATDFVTAYATGELTPEVAMERLNQYDNRWRESIMGVTIEEGMTNEEILRLRDKAASKPETDWAEDVREKGGKGKGR